MARSQAPQSRGLPLGAWGRFGATKAPVKKPVAPTPSAAFTWRTRALGVSVALSLTFAGLWLAWSRPQDTALHFWLVVQGLPLGYWLLLLLWGPTSPEEPADEP